LDLDQEAVSFAYREPTNATWDDEEDATGDYEVLFYPELMIPKNLPSPMSPFVATSWNFKDIGAYQSVEGARRNFKEKLWPALQRAYVHFENGNLDLMRQDCQTLTDQVPVLTDGEEIGGWLRSMNRYFFDFFVSDPELSDTVGHRCAVAYRSSETELRRLAAKYVKSGRMLAIWKEVNSVRRQFLSLYESLQPLLMVRRYWKSDCQNIGEFGLSVKNFEDLKGFYIDCVETTFRLLVIGLGVELIATTGKPIINAKSGNKSIWWFEQMNNGIKEGQLKNHKVFDSITPSLDLSLRNGVGHHSAHYDVRTDRISFVKARDADLNATELSFTEFVDKTFKAYCAFETATVFFQWLFIAGKGELR
jgi:hypothetical protein